MKIITIDNIQVKNKIKNFIKTCDSTLLMQKKLDQTMQVINAFKLLIRFLKNDSTLAELYEKFDSIEKMTDAFTFSKEIVSKDFVVEFEDEVAIEAEEEVEEAITTYEEYKIGEIVTFGKKLVRDTTQPLTWRVVEIKDGKALLFAEKSYFWEQFDTEGSVNWADCTLRKKLNEQWIDEVFSSSEQEKIAPCQSEFGQDYVFILSMEDILKYVPDVNVRCDSKSSWWTATRDNDTTLKVIQRNGEALDDGSSSTKKLGVRPAIWIKTTPEQPVYEIEEENTDLPVKKVLIVKDKDVFFLVFVSDRDVIQSNRIKNDGKKTTRYTTLSGIKDAIKTFKTVNANKYRIEEIYIDLAELEKKEKEIASRRYELHDKEGKVLVYFDFAGKSTFPWREEDFECRLINKVKYNSIIKPLIEIEEARLQSDFDYYYIGTSDGYRVALDCDAPHIRFEIFKAENVIKDFEEQSKIVDIYTEEIKYHQGYIAAMENALNIQHGCVWEEKPWSLSIVDLRKKDPNVNQFDSDGYVKGLGDYKLRIYNEIPTLDYDDGSAHVVLAYVDKDSDEWKHRDTEISLNSNDNVLFSFGNSVETRITSSNLTQFAVNLIIKNCTLGSGDTGLKISSSMVPILNEYQEYFQEDVANKKDALDNSGASMVYQALDLRYTDSKTALREYGFKDNAILQNMKLPLNTIHLPEGIFYNCQLLNYATLPEEIRTIGKSAFEGCTLLQRIYLPNSMKRIEDRAFCGCKSLRKLYFPQNLEYIGSRAFADCKRVTKIYLSSNIMHIEEDAFEGCTSIKYIEAPEGLKLNAALMAQANVKYYSETDYQKNIEENNEDLERNDNVIVIGKQKKPQDDYYLNGKIRWKEIQNSENNNDKKQNEEIHIENEISQIKENAVPINDRLNSVLLLLEESNESIDLELSSVINLLDKELKNNES